MSLLALRRGCQLARAQIGRSGVGGVAVVPLATIQKETSHRTFKTLSTNARINTSVCCENQKARPRFIRAQQSSFRFCSSHASSALIKMASDRDVLPSTYVLSHSCLRYESLTYDQESSLGIMHCPSMILSLVAHGASRES